MTNNGASEAAATPDDGTFDVGARRVAAVYAKAFFAAAEKAGNAEQSLEELSGFADMVARHPRLRNSLFSHMVGSDEKVEALGRALAGRISPLTVNFFRVLAKHDRLSAIAEIEAEFERLLDAARGRVEVEVTSATPLDHASETRVTEQLRRMVGGEPRLVRRIDPSLIGGVILRIEDTVYDGTVKTRLTRLRGQMINRSVHEIQSRRDRFRPAAGN